MYIQTSKDLLCISYSFESYLYNLYDIVILSLQMWKSKYQNCAGIIFSINLLIKK
jgi:hypothetical protein